jgi:hypothetical protein
MSFLLRRGTFFLIKKYPKNQGIKRNAKNLLHCAAGKKPAEAQTYFPATLHFAGFLNAFLLMPDSIILSEHISD